MNTRSIKNFGWQAKLIALLTAAIFVASASLVNIGSTLAAPGDIVVRLECVSGISAGYTAEVGQTKALTATSLNQAYSAKPDIASVGYTPGTSINNVRTTGVRAGVATVAYGTKSGVLGIVLYQITDEDNVSAYTIRDGGEVYFDAPGATKNSPVTVTAGSHDRIEWRSTNTNVATVNGSGAITSTGLGAAIVIGSFTDKWGVDRDLHLLVGVGVILSGSGLDKLLGLIDEGGSILAKEAGQYTAGSIETLEAAVNGGIALLEGGDPSAQEILDAISALENALGSLEKKPEVPPGVVGPDTNGNYYKPVGEPENVFEVVDEKGNSLDPGEYVYNEYGDPVGEEDENLPAYNLDGAYWVHVGQNVWQEVIGLDEFGPLTGGGPDGNPVTSPAQPIFEHRGKYFVGPLGPKDDPYYYGDKLVGGNGTLDSTAGILHGTDEKFYLNKGVMTNKKPIVDGSGQKVVGKVLSAADAGDVSDWVEIARNGDYSLIVRTNYINVTDNGHYNDPMFQYDLYMGGKYSGSTVRAGINRWFTGTDVAYGADKLPAKARLRDFTVKNNATSEIGTGPGPDGLTSGFSKPSHDHDRAGSDTAFALSYGEAANYVSKTYSVASGEMFPSNSSAAANFSKVKIPPGNNYYNGMWLRSPGTATSMMSALGDDGRVFQRKTGGVDKVAALLYPALWVETAIFD